MAPCLTHPLTEISSGIFMGVKGSWPIRLTTSLPTMSPLYLCDLCYTKNRVKNLYDK